MSVNRKVTVPRVSAAGSVIAAGAPVGGQCRSASVRSRRRPARPRRIASATLGSSRRTASKSQVARARQVGRSVGDDLGDPRPAVEHRQLAEEVARAERGDDLRRRGRPGPAGRDDEEAGPDLALAGDDVVGREVDLDRDRGDPVHARGVDAVEQRRRGQQLGVRSRVRVMGPPTGSRPCCAARCGRVNTSVTRAWPCAVRRSGTMRRWPDARSSSTRSPASRCSPT